jgi:hypothetical protein
VREAVKRVKRLCGGRHGGNKQSPVAVAPDRNRTSAATYLSYAAEKAM